MHITAKVNKVCSSKVDFDLIDGKVYNVVFTGGCNGNLKAIGRLVEGMEREKLVSILKVIRAGRAVHPVRISLRLRLKERGKHNAEIRI